MTFSILHPPPGSKVPFPPTRQFYKCYCNEALIHLLYRLWTILLSRRNALLLTEYLELKTYSMLKKMGNNYDGDLFNGNGKCAFILIKSFLSEFRLKMLHNRQAFVGFKPQYWFQAKRPSKRLLQLSIHTPTLFNCILHTTTKG